MLNSFSAGCSEGKKANVSHRASMPYGKIGNFEDGGQKNHLHYSPCDLLSKIDEYKCHICFQSNSLVLK